MSVAIGYLFWLSREFEHKGGGAISKSERPKIRERMLQETENGWGAQTVRPKEVFYTVRKVVSRAKLERWFRVFREPELKIPNSFAYIQSICCLFCRRNGSQDLVNNWQTQIY